MPSVPLLILTLLLTACGKSGGGGSSASGQRADADERGMYRVVLNRVTEAVTEEVVGTASLVVSENRFNVRLNLSGGAGGTHQQGVTLEGDCGHRNTRLLIPFDGDLDSQDSGADAWPRGSSYRYDREGKWDLLLDDLTRADSDPEDNVVKLRRGEALNLAGRTLTVYATANEARFPVACGKIIRVPEEL